MNTRIEKDFSFQTAVHFNDTFYVNLYDMTLSILVETDSIREQNIAMDRALYFLSEILQNSILIHSADIQAIEKYKAAGIKVCEVSEEPYDQIVAMVVLLKLNAIMEGRLRITDLLLSSSMGENIRFTMVAELAETILAGNYWWNKPSICINHTELDHDSEENVVKLFNDTNWSDLGLSWKEKKR